MEKLIKILAELKKKTIGFDLSDERLLDIVSVYPFNKFEYVISHLLSLKIFTLDDYLLLRQEYISRNKYLHLFEITAPRSFGETWAQNHLSELVQEFERPTKALDDAYKGEYDFYYKGIKIEVKASRAVERKSGESLVDKALASDTNKAFDMNFQQIKPRCCDVFVWIGVWRDIIRYWVIPSETVQNNKYFSKGQHRGNVGEGQLWIKNSNMREFDEYLCQPREILSRIECICGI